MGERHSISGLPGIEPGYEWRREQLAAAAEEPPSLLPVPEPAGKPRFDRVRLPGGPLLLSWRCPVRPCGCPNDVRVFGHTRCPLTPPAGEWISPCADLECLVQHFNPDLVRRMIRELVPE